MIALDLAIKAGIAIYDSKSNAICVSEIIEHNPIFQLEKILNLLPKDDNSILIEEYVYFRESKVTVSSLLKRVGYIQYSLEQLGKSIEMIYPTSYQSWFVKTFDLKEEVKKVKGKSKKKKVINSFLKNYYNLDLTDNHTDAMSMILYKLNSKDLPKCQIM